MNAISWFELPVLDMDRAKQFYETVFDITIDIHDLGDFVMGWFPGDASKSGAAGALVKHQSYQPSEQKGPLLYFSCRDLSEELARVEPGGGTVVRPKTAIGNGHGYMALILDSEGNRVALHSQM